MDMIITYSHEEIKLHILSPSQDVCIFVNDVCQALLAVDELEQ